MSKAGDLEYRDGNFYELGYDEPRTPEQVMSVVRSHVLDYECMKREHTHDTPIILGQCETINDLQWALAEALEHVPRRDNESRECRWCGEYVPFGYTQPAHGCWHFNVARLQHMFETPKFMVSQSAGNAHARPTAEETKP